VRISISSHSSLCSHESAPQTASRSVQPFLHNTEMCTTHIDTQTTPGRLYRRRAGDAAQLTYKIYL